jgi:hypothetical protein
MRVVIIGGMSASQCLWSLKRGFERVGCDVAYYPTLHVPEGGRHKCLRPDVAGYTSSMISDITTDLLVWWQPKNDWHPDVLRKLKARYPGLPTCMVSIDDPNVWTVLDLADYADFDYAVTCCAGSMDDYRAHGITPILGWPPFDEDLHTDLQPDPRFACDISFIASHVYRRSRFPRMTADRVDMVERLHGVGRLALYGSWNKNAHDWGQLPDEYKRFFRGWLPYRDQPAMMHTSRINVASHIRSGDTFRQYMTERDVLILASGGFWLTDYVDGMDELFRPDVEAVYWRSLDELVEKAKWWLAHNRKRKAVAAAGQARAHELLSNTTQARAILTTCGVIQ